MARLVIKTATGPVKVGDKDICMCGLSKNQPFCDDSHDLTKDEGESTYFYTDGQRQQVQDMTVGDAATGCGDNCSCGHACSCGKDDKKTTYSE